MGEAKQRKANDPYYGKIPKNRPERGIVVSPKTHIDGSEVNLQGALDTQNLRFWLLFWDKLVWPDSNIIHIVGGPDESFLMQEGILERPRYTFDGDGAQALLKGQLTAFEDREKENPGLWALAQGNGTLTATLPKETGRGVLIELHHAVPIPRGDVPLAEILEFKEKRLPELYQLRTKLDSLYQQVINSNDSAFALRSAIDEIDKACLDLIKVNKEWRFPKVTSKIDLGISVPLASIGGALASLFAGAPIELTALSTMVHSLAPQISLNAGNFGLKSINKGSPYLYSAYAHREL